MDDKVLCADLGYYKADNGEFSEVPNNAKSSPFVFRLMKNPSVGKAYVYFETGQGKYLALDVFDLQGRIVASTSIAATIGYEEIDLSKFAEGQYLIQGSNGIEKISLKLIARH
ncbi:MAG: T9SS type A sorting domain-containing protein [Chitinophagales bacterium]